MVDDAQPGTFAARLRAAIKSRGMSEAEFGRRIGMLPNYLSRVLNDPSYRPQPETIVRYAEGLDIAPEEVAGWTDVPLLLPQKPAQEEHLLAETLSWIEQQPGLMAEFKRMGETHSPDVVRRAKINLARAWAANMRMLIDSMALGGES